MLLDDGREVRLIGALAPRAEDAGAGLNAWPAETEAVRLLTGLVLGRTVRLAFGTREVDRYGRALAHLFVGQEGADIWVQGEMLARGAARAYGVPGTFDCAAELRAQERVARDARKGLWALGPYAVMDAEQTRRLLGRRNRFAIVSGVVREVARTTRAIYLNFGSDWKTDFTARIAKEVASAHPAFDQALDGLKGRAVEIRGWIERRNGPLIDIADPSQIDSGGTGVPLVSEKRGSVVAPAGADGAAGRGGSRPGETLDAPPENKERPADPLGTKPGALEL